VPETIPDALFSEIRLGGMTLSGRLVRSATHMRMAAEDGSLLGPEVEIFRTLSAGGIGLVVTGHCFVRPDGKCSSRMLGLDSDKRIAGFRDAAEAVHAVGPARIVAQINHGGAQIPEDLRCGPLLAPSPREDVPEARPMTSGGIRELVAAYAEAAGRARRAGLDGVQIHCAHGYLVNQMLSPATNRRTDRYGGGIEGRSRFLLEIVGAIREEAGTDFPVLLKIASHDRLAGGLSLEDSIQAARKAVELGVCAVEVSGGMPSRMNIRKPLGAAREGFFAREAAAFKEALPVPVISVHGYRSLSTMRRVVDEGSADMVSLSRPLIREPDLAERLRGGLPAAGCISCNLCLKHREGPVRCWDLDRCGEGP